MSKYDGTVYRSGRVYANLTQEQAAQLLYTTARTISDYERGETLPNDDMIFLMAKVYGDSDLPRRHLKKNTPYGDYIPDPVETNSIYEAITDFNLIDDDAHEVLNNFKKYIKDGALSEDEKELLRTVDKETIKQMRKRINGIFNYIEGV